MTDTPHTPEGLDPQPSTKSAHSEALQTPRSTFPDRSAASPKPNDDEYFSQAEFEDAGGTKNRQTLAKQKLAIMCAGGIVLVAGVWWVASDSLKVAGGKDETVKLSMEDAVDSPDASKQWMSRTEVDQQQLNARLNNLSSQEQQLKDLQSKLSAAQSEKSSMESDGKQVFGAYEQENAKLRAELEAARAGQSQATSIGSPGLGPNSPIYRQAGTGPGVGAAPAQPPMPPVRTNEIKLISFTDGKSAMGSPAERGNTVYSDSPSYLPPNSIATAKVIVGVDATAGVKSQSDPLPVVLRVTGPARSVYGQGRLLKTKIQGCLVNGAAMGDLSSEKVYVKLQRMTCPQPGGRYAVSEVKGFISFAGKTGVRGRVVSREGGLATQAFFAGLVGGFGRGFSANANSLLNGASQVSVNGEREKLSTSDILEGGLGQGAAKTGDMVSKYLIERAEQYQPVIEMPTGIDVEIVFLDGAYIHS